MPKIRRNEPPYLQIATHYQRLIATGEIAPGEQLPTLRDIADAWSVSLGTAQRAVEKLKAAHLVHAEGAAGTFVNGGALRLTPQDRLEAVWAGGAAMLRTEQIRVIDAGQVPIPEYVAGNLGLDRGGSVIRREQVFADQPSGAPQMLAVSWFPPDLGAAVPELLYPAPLPGGEIALITERTGRAVTYTDESYEARGILDDGRESPLLGLPVGSTCEAGVYLWADGDGVLEYGEFVLPARKVINVRRGSR